MFSFKHSFFLMKSKMSRFCFLLLFKFLLNCSLLRQCPHVIRIVRLVFQRVGGRLVAGEEMIEILYHARSISPGRGLGIFQREAALGQKVLQAQLRPARAIDGKVMHPNQKWRGNMKGMDRANQIELPQQIRFLAQRILRGQCGAERSDAPRRT